MEMGAGEDGEDMETGKAMFDWDQSMTQGYTQVLPRNEYIYPKKTPHIYIHGICRS